MEKKFDKKFFYTAGIIVLCVVLALALIFTIISSGSLKQSEKSFVAMGTVNKITLRGKKDTSEDIDKIRGIIEDLENEISYRKEGSLTQKINSGKSFETNRDYTELINTCCSYCINTNGCFDISVGALTTLWNIGEENQRVPSEKEIKNALKYVGGSKIRFNGENLEIKKGQKIDLGAVGKGYACDKAAEYINENKDDIKEAVVSVGGSVYLYGREGKEKWTVGIRNPEGNEGEYFATVNVNDCFVSTSGNYERYFEKDGIRYHHILSPKTGYPAQSGLKSVTIIDQIGMFTDALSTACFVAGLEEGMEIVEKYDSEAVFVTDDNKVYLTDGLKDTFEIVKDGYTLAELG